MQAIKNGCYGEVAIILTILCGIKPFSYKSHLVFLVNERNPGVKKKITYLILSLLKKKVSVTNNFKGYVLRKKKYFDKTFIYGYVQK